jgi:hypothetical protein
MSFAAARLTATILFAATALSVAGCGSATAPGAIAGHASIAGTTGNAPSESAKMICKPEAADEIAAALGARTSQPPAPTWADHLYSCRYTYPSGTMVISVKELPDEAATNAYYAAAQNRVPGSTSITILGQNGFAEPGGSVSIRKDFKVLRIDVGAMPSQFGKPAHTRPNVAFAAAAVILGCWTGS